MFVSLDAEFILHSSQRGTWYLHSYSKCDSFLNWRVIMYLLKALHLLGWYIILATTVEPLLVPLSEAMV
jgi:hypothetical protein